MDNNETLESIVRYVAIAFGDGRIDAGAAATMIELIGELGDLAAAR